MVTDAGGHGSPPGVRGSPRRSATGAASGAATAVAGPITFVGLMIPFVVKFIVGVDHRWVIAFSALAGPLLLVCSDMVARVIIDAELPVGIVTAFVGAPILVFLVRRTKMTAL